MNLKRVFYIQAVLILLVHSKVALGDDAEVSAAKVDSDARPNIILISIDTLRADHLGAHGYSRNTSPNIDAFAKKGALFKNAMCNWPKTTPSFVSMLTSTYGSTNGIKGGCKQLMPLDLVTMAEVIEKEGYKTGAVSNNANLSIKYQFNQGFQDFIEIWEDSEPHDCVKVTNHAIEWLEEQSGDDSLFLWVHYIAPHTMYEPAAPFDEVFVEDDFSRATRDRILPLNSQKSYFGGLDRKRTYLPPYTNLNHYISMYDGEIAYVDSEVGRLLERISGLGLDENTIIILTSDHGEELGEHGMYFEHGLNVNQSTMHVPFVIVFPENIPEGKIIENNVTLLGLFPTALDFAGIEIPDSVEGKSFKRLIDGEVKKERPVFSEGGYRSKKSGRYHSVVYDGKWKLIHERDDSYFMFDLSVDPNEQNDLFEKEKRIARRLKKKLTSWEKSQGIAIEDDGKPKAQKPVKPKQVELSERAKAQLEALGYIDSDSDKKGANQ